MEERGLNFEKGLLHSSNIFEYHTPRKNLPAMKGGLFDLEINNSDDHNYFSQQRRRFQLA